jgi:hypothetical protein
VPPGVGSTSAIDVQPPSSPLGTAYSSTSPARFSYPATTITSVLQDCSSPAACSRFVIQGTNLGQASSGSAAACAAAGLTLPPATAAP